MNPNLGQLAEWARGAGKILRSGYGKRHQINHKGRIDLVTEMDHLSEEYLLGLVRSNFPGHSIESEESGLHTGLDETRWYIDPLDGTTNYAHHIPVFCVSIAFAVGGRVQMGVVYDPMRDECFTAERGKGAFVNGTQLSVSTTGEFSHSLLATGFPYDIGSGGQDNLEQYAHFARLTQGVRRMGAAALDLCYVAAGRYDGYWELAVRPWDVAAGALLIEEAGGRVTKADGDPDYLIPPCTIASGNPLIYQKLLQDLRELA